MADRVRVLFVCLGNICRSPTAEGVLRAMAEAAGLGDRIEVDSAGTGGYHIGAPPDARSIEHAGLRGYDLSGLRARRVVADDFGRFDLVLAMDGMNRSDLVTICPPVARERLRMCLEFAREAGGETDVPDPYIGGSEGFERVLDLLEDACRGILAECRARLGLAGQPERG